MSKLPPPLSVEVPVARPPTPAPLVSFVFLLRLGLATTAPPRRSSPRRVLEQQQMASAREAASASPTWEGGLATSGPGARGGPQSDRWASLSPRHDAAGHTQQNANKKLIKIFLTNQSN